MGATAIEDKLQDGVPETIANLAKVNKMLTPSSLQTCTCVVISFLFDLLTCAIPYFCHMYCGDLVLVFVPGQHQDLGIDGRQAGDGHQHWLLVQTPHGGHAGVCGGRGLVGGSPTTAEGVWSNYGQVKYMLLYSIQLCTCVCVSNVPLLFWRPVQTKVNTLPMLAFDTNYVLMALVRNW